MSLEHSSAHSKNNVGNKASEPFVSEREAAKFLNLTVKTIQRMRIEPPINGRSSLPFYKFGTRVTYLISDCLKYAKDRQFNSTSEVATR
jgi:hypothetical protein